ncbi:MAG TPA: carboxymuconolactone decarboxylase family protein, partial [Caulobacteraceae bacterium]|nr:carboxymuconolactone decarboxylase family protein [Caulobacteraceae bacterium]
WAAPAPRATAAIEAAARAGGLTDAAVAAAKTAAAIMGMNGIYHRATHLMTHPEYRAMPARLRMTGAMSPGVARLDFELCELAVSAIVGCGACLDAHERAARSEGASAAAVHATLRIAAVVNAVGRVLAAEAAAAS